MLPPLAHVSNSLPGVPEEWDAIPRTPGAFLPTEPPLSWRYSLGEGSAPQAVLLRTLPAATSPTR